MNDIMIRDATVWDAYSIVNMWEKEMEEMKMPGRHCDEAEKEKFLINILNKITNPSNVNTIFVAGSNKNLKGFIMCSSFLVQYGYPDYIGFCEHVYVEPEYRNGKLFDKMLNLCIDKYKRLGVKQFEFTTTYDSKLAKVYQRKGYTPSQITYRKEV